MKTGKRITITLLSLLGLALAIELCIVYYNANFAIDAQPSICAINESMDCDSVAKTAYSQFLGVPLSLWGVCLYLFVLFINFVDKLKNIKFLGFLGVFKNPSSYIFCITLLSFFISMGLGYISVQKINSICIFCFLTYFIDLIIALVSKDWGKSIVEEIKISISDFIEAIKVKRYALWFTLLVLLGCSILLYTTTTNILTPQIAKRNEMVRFMNEYKDIVDGKTMGKTNATVIIEEFIDFNCGGCFMANLYLHRIISEFENVKVTQHILPLEQTCNHNMKFEGHKNSCLKAQYALAAAKQNKYWQMSDLLFAENPEDEKEIIEHARLLDFDIKKLKEDAHSEEIKQEITDSIKLADSKDISVTPTIYVGMRKTLGISSYPSFRQLVIEQGGKEKTFNE
ncbi:thioredoxin domain-containing protein [bacterium]|nr:thioredoxin domain-containing protein [bacterium]